MIALRHWIIAFWAGWLAFPLSAQDFLPGFIITNQGDSVLGFVNLRSDGMNETRCVFHTAGGEKTTYEPGSIKAYGVINRIYYTSRELPVDSTKKIVFARTLVRGVLTLYYYGDNYFAEKDNTIYPLVLSKNNVERNGKNYTVEVRRYVGTLNLLIADCQMSAGDTRYNEAGLTKLVSSYNRCKGHPGQEFKSQFPVLISEWYFLVGAARSTLKIGEYPEYEFPASFSVPLGIGVEVVAPRMSDRVGIGMEFWVYQTSYKIHTVENSSGIIRTEDVSVNGTFLKVPMGLEYLLRDRRNSPYLKLGVTYTAWLGKKEMTIIKNYQIGPTPDVTITSNAWSPRDGLGLWAGVGYLKQIHGRLRGFVEFRYEHNNGISTSKRDQPSSVTQLTLLAGIRF